jgi:hypothetical protein
MPSMLYEANLFKQQQQQNDTPFLDEDAAALTDFLRSFAECLEDSDDLGESIQAFCEANELDEDDADGLAHILIRQPKMLLTGRKQPTKILSRFCHSSQNHIQKQQHKLRMPQE